jgi:biotin transport system substrate-specific component
MKMTTHDLALAAVFCGIVAALGLVPALYPFGIAVPIPAQSMG